MGEHGPAADAAPMSTPDLDAYAALLAGPSPERALLEDVPWMLDARAQPREGLVSSLLFDARRLHELQPAPLFSIVTPLHDTPPRFLRELVASCRAQSWQRWELLLVDDGSRRREHLPVARALAEQDARLRLLERPTSAGISGARNAALEHARGDYVAFLDHDDLLHPSALAQVAIQVAQDPTLDVVFSNEAKLDATSRHVTEFLSKPDLDPFTLLRVNYVAHLLVVRARALEELRRRDGAVFRSRFDGAEDHDLVLRLALQDPPPRTRHLPLFLYYWRRSETSTAASPEAKPAAASRAAELLREHLTRLHGPDSFELTPPGPGRAHSRFSVKLRVPAGAPRPTLAVVVPFRDQFPVTLRCLEALERQVHTLDVRVLLVDNGSREPATRAGLEAWRAGPRRNRYELLRDDGAFNFARLNNDAVRARAGDCDLLLFLNNDVELVSSDVLEALAGHLLRDASCGFAGVRLLYPWRGQVQHGGVAVVDSFTGSGYYSVGHLREEREFVGDEHVVMAVTFACAMTRRATFDALGGLDARVFPNGFGDVDVCLRALAKGLRNHYFGSLEGIHHEGLTRGRTCEDAEIAALHERHGAALAHWRLRQLCFDLQPRWVYRTAGLETSDSLVPLRYRIADNLNDALRRVLGRWHGGLKTTLIHRENGRRRS